MLIDVKIKDEKLQHGINREVAKISALSSGKIYKYECLTGEELPSSDQRGMIKQAKFTYSPLEKALEKDWKSLKQLWLMLIILIIFLVIVLRLNLTKKSETAGADSK